MKEEIMGLWGILFLSSYLSIKNLMVAGDSKVTMDWINDKANLNAGQALLRGTTISYLILYIRHAFKQMKHI
jgi:hypothetical protein